MKIKEHTRNQKRMYRIHKQEEKIHSLELLVGSQKQEIDRLNNIINECAEDILKELKENHHLSYGVALSIRQKLINYKELKEDNNE